MQAWKCYHLFFWGCVSTYWPSPAIGELRADFRVAWEVASEVTRTAGDDHVIRGAQRLRGAFGDGDRSSIRCIFGFIVLSRVPLLETWIGGIRAHGAAL
jgi:hypothetical protein